MSSLAWKSKKRSTHCEFLPRLLLLLLLLLLIGCGLCVARHSGALLCGSSSGGGGGGGRGGGRGRMVGGLMGAPKEVKSAENSAEIDDVAKFAVSEHNAKHGGKLALKKVVSAQKQVVSGTMYHLTLEVHEADQPKLFDAKVWTKPWENKKTLEHFKESESSASSQ